MAKKPKIQVYMIPSNNTLATHEWLSVFVLIGLLGCFSLAPLFYSSLSESDLAEPHYLLSQDIEVKIEGAVLHPGTYQLKRGASMQELLEKAIPLEEANLTRVNPKRKLKDGLLIKIPAYKRKKK